MLLVEEVSKVLGRTDGLCDVVCLFSGSVRYQFTL